ncbi:hypothetical protein AC1031_022004 [Aphanomyces cochlioides]|nr:hypothetical protein AC1031_022004 [Aphanomyces cochlioides]
MVPPGVPLITKWMGSFAPSARIVRTAVMRYACLSPPEIFDEPPRMAHITFDRIIVKTDIFSMEGSAKLGTEGVKVSLRHLGHRRALPTEAMAVGKPLEEAQECFVRCAIGLLRLEVRQVPFWAFSSCRRCVICSTRPSLHVQPTIEAFFVEFPSIRRQSFGTHRLERA